MFKKCLRNMAGTPVFIFRSAIIHWYTNAGGAYNPIGLSH